MLRASPGCISHAVPSGEPPLSIPHSHSLQERRTSSVPPASLPAGSTNPCCLFFLSPNYPQCLESTEINFAEFLHLLCPSLQLCDIACLTSRHSKWELMRRSPRLALTSRPLPSSVNLLLLFFLFALCKTALEMEMHAVTPG